MATTGTVFGFESILEQLNGFGKYQKVNLLLICIPMVFTAFTTVSYVFTAGNSQYRCRIPECESENSEYRTNWFENAIPKVQNQFRRCARFVPNNDHENGNFSCSGESFMRNKTEKCDQFIFDEEHTTIVNDFHITCAENQWKLALVGTVSNIGQFVCLPASGYFSDRFGRRTVMITGLLLSCVFGILRSFSTTYLWFILFEFLDMSVGAGAYSAGFIIGVELVSAKHRVLAGTMLSSCYAIGEALLGVVAWYTRTWRTFLRCLYCPIILLVSYFWLTPESVRWLISKNKMEEAERVLKQIAKVNKTDYNEKIANCLVPGKTTDNETTTIASPKTLENFSQIFVHSKLSIRFINCAFCWITCNVVYYGLSLNSVAVSGNIYINFIGVSLIEIPGYILTVICMGKLGRRYTLSGSLLVAGLACIGFIFVPENQNILRLCLYMLGKCAVTVSFTSLYVFTTEMFPTPLRHSVMGTCSMFGRTGSMLAPQTPLLALIWAPFPLVIFGTVACLSGLCVLAFPETLNIKLPDTIREAKNIGKKQKGIAL